MKTEVPLPIPFYTQRVEIDSGDLQGFHSASDAAHWQERGCGIASLRMVIDGFRSYHGQQPSPSYGQFVYDGVASGAYCDRGWIHAGLVALALKYGLKGRSLRKASVQDLAEDVMSGKPCIASVSVCFRGGQMDEDSQLIPPGGHLVVVIGVVQENGKLNGFVVNHPSSRKEYNWERRFIDLTDFRPSFSGAYMSFWI